VKGLTAAWANAMLGLTGRPFWQDEVYRRVVRYEGEFEEIWNYIEEDPVRAGMVRDATQYPWSSAAADAIIQTSRRGALRRHVLRETDGRTL
jgi:hypothetical protein